MKIFFLALLLATNSHAASKFRIISLSPAITEILFALDLGDQIVGTTTFSDYPEQAKKIPVVGSYIKPSIEKIIEIKPTHVLVFKEGDPSIKSSLAHSHLNVTIFDDLSLAGFETLVTKLGDMFDKQTKAKEIITTWKNQIALLENSKLHGRKFMIEVDHNPIYIAGKNTFLSEIFEKCGMKNAFSNIDGFKRVSEESVISRKPEVILVVGALHDQMDFNRVRNFWKNNPTTKGSIVIQGRADDLSRLGPRLPAAALQICSRSDLK